MGRCTCWRVCPDPCRVRGCAVLPGGRAPASTIRRAPPRPCRAGTAARSARQGRFPSALDPYAPRAQQSDHGRLPRQCGHRGQGVLVVGAGPWARIAPGVNHGKEGLQRPARAARWTAPGRTASVTWDRFRSEAAPIVDARWWPMPRTVMPRADHADGPPAPGPTGPALSPFATRRGAGQAHPAPGGHRSGGAHLRINGPWPLPLPRAGTRRRSLPAPPTTPDDRSAQRQARGPGPLFERSGQQATGPSDHRPRPNRSTRTNRPTPQTNATASTTPAP